MTDRAGALPAAAAIEVDNFPGGSRFRPGRHCQGRKALCSGGGDQSPSPA